MTKKLIVPFSELPPIEFSPWKAQIKAALFALKLASEPWNKQTMRALRPYLPYCLRSIGNNDHLFLNRAYKPLGMTGFWATYEDYEELFVKGSDPALQRLLANMDAGSGGYFLFDDWSAPWVSEICTQEYITQLALIE